MTITNDVAIEYYRISVVLGELYPCAVDHGGLLHAQHPTRQSDTHGTAWYLT